MMLFVLARQKVQRRGSPITAPADPSAVRSSIAPGAKSPLRCPSASAKPVALVNALYRLAKSDRRIRLRIFTGLSLVRPPYRTTLERRFVEPLLKRLFDSYPDLEYTKALRGGGLQRSR